MKNLILFFFLVCCQWVAQAQVFAPEGSKWWYCERQLLSFPPYFQYVHDEEITYSGDTLVNGFSYKKIGNQLAREAGDTVFVFNGGEDYVLLNFSLEVGDTIRHLRDKTILYNWTPGGSYMTFQVTEKGKIVVQNDSLRYYRMVGIHTDFPEWDVFPPPLGIDGILIEKIGLGGRLIEIECPSCSPSGLYLLKFEYSGNPDYYFPNPLLTTCGWLDLEEQTIQTAVQVYPNPFSDSFRLQHMAESPVRFVLTDMQGREVMRFDIQAQESRIIQANSLSSGLYFLRGTDALGNVYAQKLLKK